MHKIIFLFFIVTFNKYFGQELRVANYEIDHIDKYLQSKKFTKNNIKDLKNNLNQEYFTSLILNPIIPGKFIVCEINLTYGEKMNLYEVKENNLFETNKILFSQGFYDDLNKKFKQKNINLIGKIEEFNIIRKEGKTFYILTSPIILGTPERIDKNTISYTEETYILEYKTSDFKNFIPTRYKKSRENEWNEIK